MTYLNEALLDVLKHFEIVNFREVMHERSDNYDVAVVEGSVIRPHDVERIQKIRETAKIVVAYGSCAALGGVNGIIRNHSIDEAKKQFIRTGNLLLRQVRLEPLIR